MSERILDVIEAFSAHRAPFLLSELAASIDAPKSSCFQVVKLLQRRGYLYSLGPRRGFYPTRRLFGHAKVIAESDPALNRLDGMLTELRNQTQETVIVGVYQDETVLYVNVIESLQNIRYSALPGDCKPLHSSAIGKAFLGAMPEETLRERVAGLPLEKMTSETITSQQSLLDNIEKGRQRGYFVTRGENVTDVMGCARTIDVGGTRYGIAVAGPLQRLRSREKTIAGVLRESCERMERLA